MRLAGSTARDRAQVRFAAAIDAYRDPAKALAATGRREAARCLVDAPEWLAEPITQSLAAAGITVVDALDLATVTVIGTSPHPDVPADFDADTRRGPHLHLGVRGAIAVIGPLVVPGVTSCLRCAHLHRKDADPTWPLRAVQWSHEKLPEADPLLSLASAVLAAGIIRWYVDGPEQLAGLNQHRGWANRAWHLRLPDLAVTDVPRHVHPLCGCLWLNEHVRPAESDLWESA